MQTAMETLYTDEQSYALGLLPKLQAIEPSLSSGKATPTVTGTPGTDDYTVVSTSVTGNAFTISKTSAGIVTRSCGPTANKGKFGCPTNGSW
jgi:hypothetical protein